jgi:hypothetical protein
MSLRQIRVTRLDQVDVREWRHGHQIFDAEAACEGRDARLADCAKVDVALQLWRVVMRDELVGEGVGTGRHDGLLADLGSYVRAYHRRC